MKKTNLFKKMTAMALAAMMILSAVPMMASAATPNGDYWETLTYLTFDDFTRNSTSDYAQNFTKTVNAETEDEWTYTIDLMSAWNGSLHGYSGSWKNADVANTWTDYYPENMVKEWPIPETDRGFLINRNGVTISSTWTPGRSTSQLRGLNLFDTSKIAVGDKVKITTWVYPADIYTWDSTNDSPSDIALAAETDEMQCGFRLWLWADGATDEEDYCANAPNTNATQGFVDEAFVSTIPFYKWSEVSIEYDICNYTWQNNTWVNSIRSDNAGSTYYPRNTYYAGLKVQKLVKAGGTYSIAENGTVTGSVTAGVETADENTKVIVAAYDGDMFLGCQIQNYAAAGSYDFSIAEAGDADKVMAYIWDMSTFEPQITPITCTLAQ